MDSIDTGSPDRDGHLKSSDFFNTGEYPTMTFPLHQGGVPGRRRLPHHR
ncbi:YceI family protein [Streptomyces thioluteus]